MKNINKLEKVKKFLEENNIKYARAVNKPGKRDLWIPTLRIAIKIDSEDGQLFFKKYRRWAYPVFIRDNDTPKFVLEKVQNTIIKAMTRQQVKAMRIIEKKEKERLASHNG
ncbi:hypothetical protein [Prevotella amnii]|uniref:Uncharacterized protein n=1 Tax=Prevotella amnii DNF00058 TaxID=1401066 RepID=A0A096D4I4_9BACT|nr:hypothetical protein [Prevotella amnii]KGF52434.1 hypothetical protein HMPREF9302_03950 [Prevotella amnii DNF00058]